MRRPPLCGHCVRYPRVCGSGLGAARCPGASRYTNLLSQTRGVPRLKRTWRAATSTAAKWLSVVSHFKLSRPTIEAASELSKRPRERGVVWPRSGPGSLMDKHNRCGTAGTLRKFQERPNRHLFLPAQIAIIAPPPLSGGIVARSGVNSQRGDINQNARLVVWRSETNLSQSARRTNDYDR